MEEMLEAPRSRVHRFLKWTERYTKTDMVYLAGNGFWLAVGQVAIGLTALGVSAAFARFVPKDVYGNYRFLLSLFWILTAFSFTGISTVLARAVARGEAGAYMKSLRLSLIWSIPMLLIGLGMSGYYFLNGNEMLGWGCLVIALIGPFMQSAYLFGSFLEGKQAFRENAIGGILLNVIPAIGLLAAMFVVRDPVIFLLIFLGLSVLTGFGVSYVVVRGTRASATAEAKGFGNLSAHFSAMNILNTISIQADRILVFHYLGAVELAVYAFATSIPDQIKTLFNSVATLAMPRFVRRPLEEVRSTFLYRLFGLSIIAACIAGIYALFVPFIFQVLFPAYSEAVFYSMLYALTLIPGATAIPVALLEAHAAKRELYVYNTAGPLFNIAALYVCIAFFGLLGAVIARILGRLFYFLLGIVLTFTYASRVKNTIEPVV
jgi:O-antigen/teichoic acid export membrane protein